MSAITKRMNSFPTSKDVMRLNPKLYIHENTLADRSPSCPEPQHRVGNAPNADRAVKASNPGKCIVRVTCYRIRKQDPDNAVVKWHIDALRYAGILHDDTEEEINLFVSQRKVSSKVEERTEIELELP